MDEKFHEVEAELKHFGVMGMKWGKRKAQLKGWVREAGKVAKSGVTNPWLADKATSQSIKSEKRLGAKLRRTFLYQNTKDLKDVNRRIEKLKQEKAQKQAERKQKMKEHFDRSLNQKYGPNAKSNLKKAGKKIKKAAVSLDDRIAKAYGITKKNGKVTLIEIDTIPKIAATALVAGVAAKSAANLIQFLARK